MLLHPAIAAESRQDGPPAEGAAAAAAEAPVDGEPGGDPVPQDRADATGAAGDGGAWTPESSPEPVVDPVDSAEGAVATPRDLLPVELRQGECVITGEVYDPALLEPIAGVSVVVVGQGREDMTDADGRFRIGGLPPGDYLVEALKLEYSLGSMPASPRPGAPVEIRIPLRKKPAVEAADGEFMLEEETIVGEYNETSQGDFNLDLGASLSLSSVLGAEDFAKENVSDAGQAVAKVSGANVVDGKFAVVRGLADRYIGTTFNGAQISSAVSDRKAIELDLFPTSAIQAIDVSKTYRASLLGDFGGAAIDLQSRNFPKEPIAFFKVKGKYDGDLPDRFLEVPGNGLGFLGETSSPLNPLDYTRTNPANGQVRLITTPPGQAVATWTALESSRSSYPVIGSPDQELSYGMGFGNTVKVTDYLDVGYLFGHGWKQGSGYNRSSELRAPERSWEQEDFNHFTEWDLYLAASARLNEDHEVSAIFFRKHIGENQVRSATDLRDPNNGFEYGNDAIQNLSGTRPYYGADAEQLGGFLELKPLERDLQILQLSGKSRLGERGVRMRWSFTDSDAREVQPNTTFQEYTTLDFNSAALDRAQAAGEAYITGFAENALGLEPGSLTYPEARQLFIDLGAEDFLNSLEAERMPVRDPSLGRIDTLAVSRFTGAVGPGNILSRATQSVRESTTDSSIAFDLPWYFSEQDEERGFELGVGAGRIERERSNRGSLYELVYENLSASGNSQGGFDEDDFYPSTDADGDGLANLGEGLFGGGSLAGFFTGRQLGGPYYQDGSIGTDNFLGLIANNADANHDFESWHVSGHLFLGDTFLRAGLRHESERRSARFLEPKPLGEQDPAPIQESVWLPSVSLGTAVFDGRLNLLAAWSRTVARPTFFEWVPVRSFDLSSGFIRAGNPDLENSTINNFDFAAEFRATDRQTYRLSFFRKEIIDPIIGVRVPGVADAISFINGEKGMISGVEFEAELSEIGPFSLKTNVTYIDATLEYAFNTGQDVAVNFPYQPNWIANLNLGYENEEWDFGVNLIYNFTGEYATLLKTTPNFPDVVREPQHTLDLVLRKGFELDHGGKLGISVGIENLVGTDQTFRFVGGSGNVDGRIRSQTQRDRLYFAELKYEF
jgi:TonB-dependent receptor